VPIPVGYAALSELHPGGSVASARDEHTPFRFVETLWSMGQWVSPHRLKKLDDLLWYAATEGETPDVYHCCNDYAPEVLADVATV
jgi:CRISPR-associated protein Csy2